MFLRQKIATYLVTGSLNFKSNITNELRNPENRYGDTNLDCLCQLKVDYIIFMFSSQKMAAYLDK